MTPDQMISALPRSVMTMLAIGTALYVMARMLAETSERFAKILGPLGAKWTQSRDHRLNNANQIAACEEQLRQSRAAVDWMQNEINRMQSEIEELRRMRDEDLWNIDLQRQVKALNRAVSWLRERQEAVDEYIVYDYDWHVRNNLGDAVLHTPFLEFDRLRKQAAAAPPMPPLPPVGLDTPEV